MDRRTFEETLKQEGYEAVINTVAGPKQNPEHTHPFDVYAMVLEGALTLICNGESRTYAPGETFMLARDVRHAESYGPEGAVTLSGRRH